MAKIFQSVSPAGQHNVTSTLIVIHIYTHTHTFIFLTSSAISDTFINEGHSPQNLHLPNITPATHPIPNLTHIQRVIVSFSLCIGINVARILPRLWRESLEQCRHIKNSRVYLGEGSIVPDVAMVREAVVHKTHFPFLHILFDRVQSISRVDLHL